LDAHNFSSGRFRSDYRSLAWLHQGERGIRGNFSRGFPSLSEPPEAMSASYAAAFLSNAATQAPLKGSDAQPQSVAFIVRS
jgi:hypothetical protein